MTVPASGGRAVRIFVVAGEASGDQLGAGLLREIRRRCPGAVMEGIAGPRMQEQGCRSVYPMDRLSVMGLFESFGRYPELIPLRRRLAARLIADPPDVFVGIDAPDFNLSLELALRAAGVPTVHYVSPSVWAWRRYRLRKIVRAVDRMLVLFPFERDFYRHHEVPVTFVGHPMADEIPLQANGGAALRKLGLAADREWIALLPGSRLSEVRHLAGPMLRAARWLVRRRPGAAYIAPMVSRGVRAVFETALRTHGDGVDLRLIDGRARDVISASRAVLVASGTATLEALLLKRPMVITYRTTALTWFIGRRMLHVDHVGLPNLLAGEEIVPELLQEDARPEKLGAALLRYLETPALVQSLESRFAEIHASLRNGASARAGEAVLEVAGGVRQRCP